MKKIFNKVKNILTAFWVTLFSFSSKVIGTQVLYGPPPRGMQDLYGPPPFEERIIVKSEQLPAPAESTIIMVIKIASLWLVVVTFVFGIVSFIKIRKISDKTVKKKKIKNAVIAVSVLVILIIALIISFILFTKHI